MEVEEGGEMVVPEAPHPAAADSSALAPPAASAGPPVVPAAPAAAPGSMRLASIFLDTTYCRPQHAFPPQEDVVAFVRCTSHFPSCVCVLSCGSVLTESCTPRLTGKALAAMRDNRRTLIVVGTYSIGKERVFMGTWPLVHP